jgi:hypothetical protein
MSDLWEKIIVKGLNAVIAQHAHANLKHTLLSKYPDILESRLAEVDVSIQMKIVEGMLKSNPAAFKEDFWGKYIEVALSKFDSAEPKFIHDNGAWFVLLNRIKDMKSEDGVDWFDVLCKLSTATSFSGSKTQGFSTVLGWLTTVNKEYLVKLMHRTETKKYPRALKQALYRDVISAGLLDVKIARRIRSDTSGDLSSNTLGFLFEQRNQYSDDDFQNLITQFSDTKHKWVARYIALNMPIHLAPFLMGLDDTLAITILEKRMNADED